MSNSSETQFIKIIKYTPPIFILLSSIVITLFLYIEHKEKFIKEKAKIEEDYRVSNNNKIKNEVVWTTNFISKFSKKNNEQLKVLLKERVYEAHTIATSVYNHYKNIKTKDEIFELIKIALTDIRFNEGRGYFFIDDIHGRKLLYPIDKKVEGTNLSKLKDKNGYAFIQTIMKTIEEKSERFDTYYWEKPNIKDRSFKKLSFYKYFEPFDVIIGTGEYVLDFAKKIEQEMLHAITELQYTNKNSSLFIFDYDGIFKLHNENKYIGKKISDIDINKEMQEFLKKKENISNLEDGFYSFTQSKNNQQSNVEINRIAYLQNLSELSLIVGKSFSQYRLAKMIDLKQKSLDKDFEEKIRKIYLISLILTICLLFISIYISRIIENKFNIYKNDINKQQNILYQQSKMAAMGEMIGNIAHQWRQPLSVITTASTGMKLQKDFDNLSEEFFYEASETINNSAQYLSKTIDDFRNFFNPNKVKTNFLLNETFQSTFDLIKAQFNAKEINIIIDVDNITIYGYENELIQVFINILNNARDELLKKDREFKRCIFISSIEDEKKINIAIKDNAGGIPEDIMDRIFEPYFTTKHQSQGTGIGLYMTGEIIRKHLNGEISVSNKKYVYEDNNYIGAEFLISFDKS